MTSVSLATLMPPNSLPTFSGHETFALRGNWLKKAYDILSTTPELFYHEDAFVWLGVGKNMAQSIRFWGRVCGIFEKTPDNTGHNATTLGHQIFNDDDGWDPFLVTPTARWLLHWRVAARPEAAFTWFYTFNLLRGGDFTISELVRQIHELVARQVQRPPSDTTLRRDVECLVGCYCRPESGSASMAEDALTCPLLDLNLIQQLPGQQSYRLSIGLRPDLPDELVAFAIREQMQRARKSILSFNELAYGQGSPGRVFRLDEDALLSHIIRIRDITEGAAYYSDQAGIRQVAWQHLDDSTIADRLLARAFNAEARHVSP